MGLFDVFCLHKTRSTVHLQVKQYMYRYSKNSTRPHFMNYLIMSQKYGGSTSGLVERYKKEKVQTLHSRLFTSIRI
jgi:hypothetical protein